jgi:ATP-dependent RNA helicase SUPV3L1/SUV3
VRLDMLERLADVIRPLLAWRGTNGSAPPKGATGDGGFTVTPEMMSLLGCSPDELGGVLKELGFRLDRRPIKPQVQQPAAPAEGTETAPAAEPVATNAEPAAPDADAASLVAEPVAVETAPVAEASAAEAAPATAAAAEAEIKYEEVWRPRRHQRGERRPERREQRNRQRGGGRQAAAAAAPTTPAEAAPAAAAATGDAAAVAPVREPKPERRDDRRSHGKERGERGRDRDRDAAPHRRGQHGDRPRRDDRRKDDRRKAEVHTAAPPRRGGIDPDSPFAALGALRDELAKRGKESST